MFISSISSSTNVYRNRLQQMKKDFSTLQTSLSSGNVTTSQQAYAALTQGLQNAQQSQGGQLAWGDSELTTDLAAVGTALQSGDIKGVQSAFATLMQDLATSGARNTTGTSRNSINLQAVGSIINTVA